MNPLDIAADELLVDLFAGGGGASEGIRLAIGRDPDIAINHNAEAVAVHKANHPGTRHVRGDIWHANPREVCGGRSVGLLWCSPTCVFFSQAKGGPLDHEEATKVRALAWVVNRWAREVRPRVIVVENVPPFISWGPLDAAGRPNRSKAGLTFKHWVGKLRAAGYAVEWRVLTACDYGAPTSRKRLFIIARCDGQSIVWPEPTHGPHRTPYRSAASCIDWSIPVPSIFGRRKPLAEATLRRIARGIRRFVTESDNPYVVESAATFLTQQSYGERKGQEPRVFDIRKPLSTVVAGGVKHALVTAFLARHYGGNENDGIDVRRPLPTITTQDHHALVTVALGEDRREDVRAFLTKFYGTSTGQPMQLPLGTITSGGGKYGLVTVAGRQYEITDIGHRMLAPRELANAQGFRADYELAPILNGKPIGVTAQVRLIGNSVPPPPAEAIVRANFARKEAVAA